MNPPPVEILAPAGDMTCLQAALDAGADAVYLGLEAFNMRRLSTRNFTLDTLPEAAARCRARRVRLYLTFNALVYEDEREAVRETLRAIRPHADAVIAADWAVITACRDLGIPFHVSTQLSCANADAARFLAAQGAQRIVLARECTLDEVARIAATVPVEIETFVHGAICVAVSGRCLLSHEAYGRSASRGECLQPCRRRFHIREVSEGEGSTAAFEVEPHAVLSARDLCSLPFVDRLMRAGIRAFKIEGRARNPEYVHTVVAAYQAAVAAVRAGAFTPDRIATLVERCSRVYHREFGVGLYHGRPGANQLTHDDENRATRRKRHIGIVINYYRQARVAQIQIQDAPIAVGDTIAIHGPATGVVELRVTALRHDDVILTRAERGTWVTVPCPETVRLNDKAFLVEPVA